MKPYLIPLAWFVLAWFVVGAAPPSRAAAPESRPAAVLPAFAAIQQSCLAAGPQVAAALAGSACRVSKGRWFSTIGHDDLYQAQYCLHEATDPATCRRRALLLFANRAYTPEARLLLERVDGAGVDYEDPQVFATPSGYLLALSATAAPAATQTSYYLWLDGKWAPLDAAAAQARLAAAGR